MSQICNDKKGWDKTLHFVAGFLIATIVGMVSFILLGTRNG